MKGFWRTVESVLAVILLMSFLLVIGTSHFNPADEEGLGSLGYEILRDLDSRNELRSYAANGDYASIDSKVNIPGFNHSVSICGYGGDCAGESPEAQNVIVSTYIISGHDTYEPMEVRLYIWR